MIAMTLPSQCVVCVREKSSPAVSVVAPANLMRFFSVPPLSIVLEPMSRQIYNSMLNYICVQFG